MNDASHAPTLPGTLAIEGRQTTLPPRHPESRLAVTHRAMRHWNRRPGNDYYEFEPNSITLLRARPLAVLGPGIFADGIECLKG